MSESAKLMESDLFAPVRVYLEDLGYEVNGEIHGCDLVAVKADEMLVVELKKTLNLEVILQAVERQKIAETVYVAVLKPKNIFKNKKFKRTCHLLRRLEIGLMLVKIKGTAQSVEVFQIAEPFDRIKSRQLSQRKRRQVETEFANRKSKTIGGVTKTKITTAYREDAVALASALETMGSAAPKDLVITGINRPRIQSILTGNYYGWFERIDRGVYKTTEDWQKDKETHSKLL